jgi:hypothetical protein
MIELLKIRVLIKTVSLLLTAGQLFDRLTVACNITAKRLAIEVAEWLAAKDAAR